MPRETLETIQKRQGMRYYVRLFEGDTLYTSPVPGISALKDGEFELPLPPQSLRYEAKARTHFAPNELYQTADEKGINPPDIMIQGTFGQAIKQGLDGRQWIREFENLIKFYIYENFYRGQEQRPLLRMSWHDTYRQENWWVSPENIPYGAQDVSSPLRESYSLKLVALRPTDDPKGSQASYDRAQFAVAYYTPTDNAGFYDRYEVSGNSQTPKVTDLDTGKAYQVGTGEIDVTIDPTVETGVAKDVTVTPEVSLTPKERITSAATATQDPFLATVGTGQVAKTSDAPTALQAAQEIPVADSEEERGKALERAELTKDRLEACEESLDNVGQTTQAQHVLDALLTVQYVRQAIENVILDLQSGLNPFQVVANILDQNFYGQMTELVDFLNAGNSLYALTEALGDGNLVGVEAELIDLAKLMVRYSENNSAVTNASATEQITRAHCQAILSGTYTDDYTRFSSSNRRHLARGLSGHAYKLESQGQLIGEF